MSSRSQAWRQSPSRLPGPDDISDSSPRRASPAKEKGKFTREELARWPEVNVSSLKDFD